MSLTIGIARKLSSGDHLGRLGLELRCISVLATLASGVAARPLGAWSGPAGPVMAASELFAYGPWGVQGHCAAELAVFGAVI